ncbi:MAG: AAA family ATPase [Desulfurococcales archaeon]|nr:AAA family ATPase [Desulfurococcales archaeon]
MQSQASRIFRDRSKLDESYIPEKLRVRNNEAELLINRYVNRLREGSSSTDITLIYGSIGKVGIGKTMLSKFVGRKLEQITKKIGINFKYVYINVYSAPSLHQILSLVTVQLGLGFSVRGSAAIEALKAITDYLYRKNMNLLVILDEFQSLLMSPRVSDDHLYLLLRVYEEIPPLDGINRISFLLVSQDFRVLSLMRERIPQVESQVGFKLHLRPYTSGELYEILEQRAEEAFHKNAWDPYMLSLIADSYGYSEERGGDGSARKAILTLRMAAEKAEAEGKPRIEESDIRWAISENAAAYIPLSELRGLNTHKLLILLSVADLTMSRGGFITTGLLRDKYVEMCEFYGESPRGNTQFHTYLKELVTSGLIEARLSGKGLRGRTTIIRLAPEIPADKFKEALESILLDRAGPGEGRNW